MRRDRHGKSVNTRANPHVSIHQKPIDTGEQLHARMHARRQLPHGAEHRWRLVLVATNTFIAEASPWYLVCAASCNGADPVELLEFRDGDQQLVLGHFVLAASRYRQREAAQNLDLLQPPGIVFLRHGGDILRANQGGRKTGIVGCHSGSGLNNSPTVAFLTRFFTFRQPCNKASHPIGHPPQLLQAGVLEVKQNKGVARERRRKPFSK